MPVLRRRAARPSWASKEVTDDTVAFLKKKHVYHETIAALSSEEDEEDNEEQDVKEEKPEDEEKPDPSTLIDDDLKAALLVHGIKAGPIVDSTRSLYERKLRRLQAGGQETSNVAEIILLCSDSEDYEAGRDGAEQESSQNGRYGYPQCFLPSSKLRPVTYASRHAEVKQTLGRVAKSSMQSIHIAKGMNRASTLHQHSALETKVLAESIQTSPLPTRNFSITQMVEEKENRRSEVKESEVHEHWSPSNRLDTMAAVDVRRRSQYCTPMVSLSTRKKDPVKTAFKDIKTAPTVTNATCRRPIKGAAGRPVRFTYPKTPVSPTTQERREVERRLVPIQIQFVAFVLIALLLLIVEDEPLSPLLAWMYKLMQGFGSEGADMQGEQAVSGQD
ncbi:lamina-associated polypeptide 2, isoforms beta/gamma-like isoform X2 [Dunckerocampus dactyliophorus]|uniref:lamina-associated polypeptide 2, isoforms beta/gamma-like isoform X2 n=1 Tax=Dunckerocampus dactyliophorus TaxID=161453 RepID=UPI002404A802|nr:lamina-associated polypeptide 2, isoforms beta/gamma-like isoform X2 [Dunckerocampus dactyliophorus]